MLLYSLLIFTSVAQAAGSCCRTSQPTLAEGAESQYICGKTGHLRPFNPKSLSRGQSCTNDYVGCYIQCAANEACVSFSYNSDTNACRLFSKSPESLRFVAKSKSTSAFYDYSNCFAAPTCKVVCPSPAPQVFNLQACGPVANEDRLMGSPSYGYLMLLSDSGGDTESEGGQIVQSYILESGTGYLKTSDGQQIIFAALDKQEPKEGGGFVNYYNLVNEPPDQSSNNIASPLVCKVDSSLTFSCIVEGQPEVTQLAARDDGEPLWKVTIIDPAAQDSTYNPISMLVVDPVL